MTAQGRPKHVSSARTHGVRFIAPKRADSDNSSIDGKNDDRGDIERSIRLKRLGKIHAPYYRIVVADSRAKRNGRVVEEIGKVQPTKDHSFIEVDSARAQHWLGLGAQPSPQVEAILKLTGDWGTFKGGKGVTVKSAPLASKDEIASQVTSSVDKLLAVADALREGGEPGAGVVRQIERAAKARQALEREFGLLTSAQVADFSGSIASNKASTAHRWLSTAQIFSVKTGRGILFPGFQFVDGVPRPVIRNVIEAFQGKVDGWSLALWFTSPNSWLDRSRPVDELEDEPEAVIAAANRASHMIA